MKVPYIRHIETVSAIVKVHDKKDIQVGIDYLTSLIGGKIGMIDKYDLEALGIEYSNCRGIIKFCEQEALAVLHRLMLAKKKAG